MPPGCVTFSVAGTASSIQGFITSLDQSAAFGEVGNYSASFRINPPLVKTINPI